MGPPHFRNPFRRSKDAKSPHPPVYGASSRYTCTHIDPKTSLPCPNIRAFDSRTNIPTGWFCACHSPGSKCSPAGEGCPSHRPTLPVTRYQCVYVLSSGFRCANWRDTDSSNQGWLCAEHKCPHSSCLNTRGECVVHDPNNHDFITRDDAPHDDWRKAPLVMPAQAHPVTTDRYCSRHGYCTAPDCGAKVHTGRAKPKAKPQPVPVSRGEENGTADKPMERRPPPCRALDCWEAPARWPDVWMCKKHMGLFDPGEPIGFADRPREGPSTTGPPPKANAKASQGEKLRLFLSFIG